MSSIVPAIERRRHPRSSFPSRLAVHLLEPPTSVEPEGINLSEHGLCLRLREALEVRSLVRLQLIRTAQQRRPTHRPTPVACTGRVAWVTQRLDVRTGPPFLYDTGIELIEPPAGIRSLLVRGAPQPARATARAAGDGDLRPVALRGRRFVPQLTQEPGRNTRWHLVVRADGVPCFSGHYGSARGARAAWEQFVRRQSRP
jgi:hypothetical protein